MPNLNNLTPFAVVDFPSLTKLGREVLVVCVTGRFRMPAAGRATSAPLPLTEEQLPPPLMDAYWGEPGRSSLRHEAQNAYTRPGTDIYITGRAWAPAGQRVRQLLTAARVGPCKKGAQVFGDRVWTRGMLGLRPSVPLPFESMPLVYERSFGGKSPAKEGEQPLYEPRNPVGCGLYRSAAAALDGPVPNLENPLDLIEGPTDRADPAGYGPIARGWQPRLSLAGTYGQEWVERRAPLWPLDFDERFFHAAAPGLSTSRPLEGGEEVVLSGFSADGTYACSLPRRRLVAKVHFYDRSERRALTLDAVHLDTEDQVLTLIWRAAFPADRELASHEWTVVREVEPWEQLPT
jgi:hypothetical protein